MVDDGFNLLLKFMDGFSCLMDFDVVAVDDLVAVSHLLVGLLFLLFEGMQ